MEAQSLLILDFTIARGAMLAWTHARTRMTA